MKEYKTRKKERYYSEVIRLYTELGYSIGHISRVFSLSYVTVKRWLAIFAEENKDKEFAMKVNSSTVGSHTESNEEIKALKAEIAHLKKELNNAQIKAELYNEMINVAERHFNIRMRKNLAPSSIGPAHKEQSQISCGRSLCTTWRNKAGLLQI